MKTTTKQTHLYSNTDLRKLLIPIIIEQLLSSLMGTVDTMMVSNVGSAAISAVSLVDSINILVIQALSALAAGGAILCSQYLGSEKRDGAIRSAQQVLFVMTVLSVALSAGCLIFRVPLLRVIFGAVEADVMKNSQVFSAVQYSLCFRVCLPIISVRGSSPGSFLSSASSLSFGTDLWGIRSRKHANSIIDNRLRIVQSPSCIKPYIYP